MSIRIPVYEQKLTPNSGGIQATARGAPVSDATGRALGNVGQAVGQVADMLARKEQADAMSDAFKKVSDAQTHWDSYLTQAAQDAPDGAAGFTPKIQGEFEKFRSDTLAGIKHPVARQWAEQHLVTLGAQVQQKALNYEAQAGVALRSTQFEQGLQSQAARVAADPSAYGDARKTVLGAVANVGYDATQRPQAALKATEALDAALWQGIVQRDPKGAVVALKHQFGIGAPAAAAGAPPAAPTVDSVWSALENRESGGKQSAVSSKGAVGVAQVMPGTGPEAAKLAGLPWDEKRFKTDADYNRALGKAYLAEQLRTFGSMDKALAAYNVVPGKVRDALAKGGDWLSRMPQETRDYVAALMPAASANVAPAPAQSLPEAPLNPQYVAWAQNLSPQQAVTFLNAAESEANRQGMVARSGFESTLSNHVAGFKQGILPDKLLTEGDFVQVYGEQGRQRYAQYAQVAEGGRAIGALQNSTDAQALAILERLKPGKPDDPLYAGAVERYNAAAEAYKAIRTQRSEDPMAFAMERKLGVKPLNMQDTAEFNAELGRRIGVAKSVSQTYAVPPLLLTKDEAKALAYGFEQASAPQQRMLLENMRKVIPDDGAFKSVMQQIRPDSPVTAYAGLRIADGTQHIKGGWFGGGRRYDYGDVAQVMLAGEALINPTKGGKAQDGKGSFPMPEDSLIRYEFNDRAGMAFAGSADEANAAYQAVKAYYAGMSARQGDYSGQMNSDRLTQSIEAVLGGISDLNGKGQVFMPYRMDEPTFERAMTDKFDEAMARNQFKGQRFTDYGAIALGNDRYYLRIGGAILYNRDKTPVVLDLSTWNPPPPPTAGGGK